MLRALFLITCMTALMQPVTLLGQAVGTQSVTRAAVTPGSSGFGARLGYVTVEDADKGTMVIGGTYDYALNETLLAGAELDYWRKEYSRDNGIDVEASDLVAAANTKLVFTNLRQPFKPYAGLGAAVHRLVLQETVPTEADDPQIEERDKQFSDTEVEFGVDVSAGIMYSVQQSVDVLGEIKYRNILDNSVDYDQLGLTGGVAYRL